MKLIQSNLLFPALLSVALFASPMAFASHHGDDHGGRDICEKMEKRDGKWDREHHEEKRQERLDTMAERLELTPDQRETWDDMQTEWKEKRAEKAKKWQEKMEKHCTE